MKIIIDEIPETGALDVKFSEDEHSLNSLFGQGLEKDFHFDFPVKGSFHISRESKNIFIDLEIAGSVKADCSRCLANFKSPINSSSHLIFWPGENIEEDGSEEEDFGKSFYYENHLNLEEILREEISLLLPFNPLCKKICKGLCSSCGQNLNNGDCSCSKVVVDRRFEVLKGFKEIK